MSTDVGFDLYFNYTALTQPITSVTQSLLEKVVLRDMTSVRYPVPLINIAPVFCIMNLVCGPVMQNWENRRRFPVKASKVSIFCCHLKNVLDFEAYYCFWK